MEKRTGDAAVEQALATMAREDPVAAVAARAAYGAMSPDNGLEGLHLRWVQEFVWYRLPTQWASGLEEQIRHATALGMLLDLVGLPRYAEVCAGTVTAEILTLWARRGDRVGRDAYVRQVQDAGAEPPDVPGVVRWSAGPSMGPEESAAFWATAGRLDVALAAGEFAPAQRGWRATARSITADWLLAERPELSRATYQDTIYVERLRRWAIHEGGPTHGLLAVPIVEHLVRPASRPDDAEQRVAALRWFLERAGDTGLQLTRTGTLARDVVTAANEEFGWHSSGRPRGESDVPQLQALRELARELAAVRRLGQRLVITRRGERLLAGGTERLWDWAEVMLIPDDPHLCATAELVLMVLLTGEAATTASLTDTVTASLAEQGWYHPRTGRPYPPEATLTLLATVATRLDLFGLLAARPSVRHGSLDPDSAWQLTPAGVAASHNALRFHAIRPR